MFHIGVFVYFADFFEASEARFGHYSWSSVRYSPDEDVEFSLIGEAVSSMSTNQLLDQVFTICNGMRWEDQLGTFYPRSMSIGDVVVLCIKGNFSTYRCMPRGWDYLSNSTDQFRS